MTGKLKVFAGGILLLASSWTLRGQTISAHAGSEATAFEVGDPIAISIELHHPRDVRFTPLIADSLGPFRLLDNPELKSLTDTTSVCLLSVARYDSGTVDFPGISFSYSLPGDTSLFMATSNPLTLTVQLVEVDTTGPIRDIKPPLGIPITLAEILQIVGIIILAAALVFFLYRYWKSRSRKKDVPVSASPPKPAHVIALEELALLREKKLWQRGYIKHYYSELTEILRRYFENRYQMTALEQTSDEILRDLKLHVDSDMILRNVQSMLTTSDLVKFAKLVPPLSEHDEAMVRAIAIIEQTRRVLISADTDMQHA